MVEDWNRDDFQDSALVSSLFLGEQSSETDTNISYR